MRSLILLFAALLAFGCSDDDERPPALVCQGTECHGPPIQGSGATTGDGDGGEPGTGGQGPIFSVSRFESDDFLTTGPFTSTAAILADGEGGRTLETSWNGFDPFTIEGLAERPFLFVEPEPGNDALPTLLSPALRSTVELPLARATVVESLLALSSVPLDLESDRAQVVLALVDATRNEPFAGATLSEATAQTVLYAASGSWSDAVTETDVTGLALLANVDAGPWPGRLTSIAVSGGAVGAIPLRTVSGAVTVLYIGIEP